LVAAAMGGDEQALTALLDAAHPHIQRFARVLCSSPSDAEDAAQEALVILFQRIGSLRAIGALSTWVFRIVRNECIRLARRQLRRRSLLEQLPPLPSTEMDVLRKLEIERIARVIANLPDDQRRVLVMRDVYGRSGHEVARDLGLSTAAMKSRLHRARVAVRTELEGGPR
jgi:RNA polymerase sigma factor (sigma-70 family)